MAESYFQSDYSASDSGLSQQANLQEAESGLQQKKIFDIENDFSSKDP